MFSHVALFHVGSPQRCPYRICEGKENRGHRDQLKKNSRHSKAEPGKQ